MSLTLTNAVLLHLDPPGASPGSIRIEGDSIHSVGDRVTPQPGDEIIDCHGAVILPGLVNGHTHLYSALAVGMPPPPRAPANFHEILELVWWRLDRAHDVESVKVSGAIGALDALRCGTTTLIDHHASPSCIPGSLDALENGIDLVGLRAVLCYETTDRNGHAGASAGLEENRRYLERCRGRSDGWFAALVGAHAAFTLSDDSLVACARLAAEFQTGVHIHVAEDPCDDRICREKYGAPLVERLTRSGILGEGDVAARSILGHCTHLAEPDAARIASEVAAIAHNPRSNMNNQVGYAPIGSFLKASATSPASSSLKPQASSLLLGTDGIGSDMLTEAGAAWFKSRDARAGLSPTDIVGMLAQSARTAGRLLDRTLGRLEPGAAADVVVTDYIPSTPLTAENVAGHVLFALGPQHVHDVLIDGAWALRNRKPVSIEASHILHRAPTVAAELWKRMQAI
ncbi:MAG TPA: amidohydrolase family protein [Phycisphaerae bacterium]|nr:amidohydrolase family protein [Phycisphaerae bacterium]